MSSSVCQGLQSCLEPPFDKLNPSRSNLSNCSSPNEDDYHDGSKNRGKDGNLGGWSFIQALTHISQTPKEIKETEKVYSHPMTKKSSILSKKSLEMCTESLGSETGSDTGEIIEELSSDLLQNHSFPMVKSSKFLERKKSVFPPPLSSITGSKTVQVWPHREGGRLLIEAVTVDSNNSCFQTERRDGRLRLFLFREDDQEYEYESEGEDEDDEEGEEVGITEGGEIGIGEISRLSRCKESGNEMSKWGPFWVAIS